MCPAVTWFNPDRIFVVTEEEIAEVGRHDELIEQGGIFANLHLIYM